MLRLIIKTTALWCLLVITAMLNGWLREYALNPILGGELALAISGIILSMLILLFTWACIPCFGHRRRNEYWLIGVIWLVLTLAFEFPFSHFVSGLAWSEIFQLFNVSRGNLFSLVLLTLLLAPWLMAKTRAYI